MCSVAPFARRVIKLRWETPASSYGEQLWIIWINNCGQPTKVVFHAGWTAANSSSAWNTSMLRHKLLQNGCVSWNLLRNFEEDRQCTYKCNIVTRSHNDCCHGNATVPSLCIVDVHVRCQQCNKYWVLPWKHSNAFSLLLCYVCHCQQLWSHLGLQVKRPIFLSILNKIWNFYTMGLHSLYGKRSHWYLRAGFHVARGELVRLTA
jgi:hypothetical protein